MSNKMDLIKQNMAKRQERTLDAFSDNMIRSTSESIPLSKIVLNPNNHAAEEDSPEDIQRLADDIATVGLLHNLVVLGGGDGRYMMISGERRYKALQLLGWEFAPCVVYRGLPDAMFRVMTVLANLDAREYSAAKRLQLYVELDSQLRVLKDLGIYRGGIGKGIAQIMGVSEHQIVKYKRLVNELSPEELAQVTNINRAVEQLKENSTVQKNVPEVHNYEDVDSEMQSHDSENVSKNVPQVHTYKDIDSEMRSRDSENQEKNVPEVHFLSEEPEQIPIRIPKEVAPGVRQHSITAGELSIEYGGTSYLCAFGRHINGGWIAILNFGVSAELGEFDAEDNAYRIEDALIRAGEPNCDKVTNAARHIGEIVTERIQKMGG